MEPPLPGPATVTASAAPAECRASGGKLFIPPLSEAELCARFTARLHSALEPGMRAATVLTFRPQGVASADVTLTPTSGPARQGRHELAVSDRGFRTEDLDRLAGDVIAAMLPAPQRDK